MLAVDIETYDPDLQSKGPGALRKNGHIIGIGVYSPYDQGYYRPDDPFIKGILANSMCKIFHNATYDLQWLYSYGFKVNGRIEDTLLRAACIDPNEKHNKLDVCCKRYGVVGKNFEATVEKWWSEHKQPWDKRTCWQAADDIPFDVWSDYCIQDCKATYNLFEVQERFISTYKLERVCDLERRLIPVTMRMLQNGVRVDKEGLKKVQEDFAWKIGELEEEVSFKTGITNVNSAPQIRAYFEDELGLQSPIKTATGNNSWDKWALKGLDNPVADMICDLRSKKTIYSTFLAGSLADDWNGRVYTQLYQTGRDEGGTITGRYSSANPNLQNIPSDDEKGGDEIRALFLPDEGTLLGAFDYKQIEYRLFAHYAIAYEAPGYEALRKAMSIGTDYHLFVQKLLKWVYDDEKRTKHMRKITKTLNFGVLYGQGAEKMYQRNMRLLIPNKGQTKRQYVDWVRYQYFDSLPFVRYTCKKIESSAKIQGYVRSIDGRRHPTEYAKAYKSVNKLIQGGAAGILKEGLVEAEEAGIWDVLSLHLTVHDENVFSIPRSKVGVEACQELRNCMVGKRAYNAPMDVDMEVGANWGEVSSENWCRLIEEVM